MQIVVLAGGLGTRLRPLTNNLPKSLIEIHGRPFLDYQLSYLEQQGATDILLIAGFKAEMISDYLRKRKSRVALEILDEGTELRGTGGALRWACDRGKLQPEFSVTYGDSLLLINYSEVWRKFRDSHATALMTVLKNDNSWDASNVIYRDGVIDLYDKKISPKPPEMKYIDYGFLVFKRIQVESWPTTTPLDLNEPLHKLSVKGGLAGFEVNQRFYEAGSHQGIKDLEQFLETPEGRCLFDFTSRPK